MWQRRCHLCQRTAAEVLCLACWGQVVPLPDPSLILRQTPWPHVHLAYAAYQPPLKNLLMDLKYRQARALGLILGRYLGQWYSGRWPLPDVLVPVPLHPLRQRERGYNQAELLARGLAEVLDRPVGHALQRQQHTPPLYTLRPEQRQQVLQGVFGLDPRWQRRLVQQRILLVDDILTTGATLLQAAATLAVCSQKIISLSAARALIADPLISECI